MKHAAKVEDIREAHDRLIGEYRLALERAAEATRALSLIEATEADLDAEVQPEPSPKALAARARRDRARAEVQVLAQRVRVSQAVLDKVTTYARLGGYQG